MMPLALRALEKLHKVVDQEMHRIGAQKIAMPSTASGELWKASGQFCFYCLQQYSVIYQLNQER